MARLKKTDTANRTLRLHIRLTREEQAFLAGRAVDQGLTVSDFVRMAAMNSKPQLKKTDPARATLIKALGGLGKIASNINQITHELHRQRLAGRKENQSEADIRTALQHIRHLSDYLLNILTDGH